MVNELHNSKELSLLLRELIYNYPITRKELVSKSGVKRRSLDSALTTGKVSAKTWQLLFDAVKYDFHLIGLADKR